MRAPLRLKRLSKEQRAHIRRIKREFHVRAFGEELARVNLDMTKKERHEYLEWMRELARKNGVSPTPRPFEDLEKEIEEELKKAGDEE